MPQSDQRTIRTVPSDTDPATGHPHAVAVRIGDRNIWLANRGGAQPEHLDAMELSPEHVVTVNRQPTGATTDHHPLRDGYVNDQAEFTAAVETLRQRFRESGEVLVHCAAGISRSTTVLATTLAVEENVSFRDAVEEVQTYRERARPHPKLQVSALSYLVAEHERDAARSALAALAPRVRFSASDEDNLPAVLDDLEEVTTNE
jgi:protein-tyrosine phosphatase